MIAAHQAWFAEKVGLAARDWKPSFNLAKEAAKQRLVGLSIECLQPRAFMPQENEFDDYTRARNLILASVLAARGLVDQEQSAAEGESAQDRLAMLLSKGRLFAWGESAVAHLLAIQWYCEKRAMTITALPELETIISALTERNQPGSEDECFPPPLVSADDVMAELFNSESLMKPNRRAPGV